MVKLVNPRPLTELDSINNVVWAALEKIGKKELQSNALDSGSYHRISLRIEGNVNDQAFSQSIESIVTIGQCQLRASSVTPQVPELVAYILSKLNRATRMRLLNDIPEEFRDNDNMLPECSPVLVDDAKQLLRRLRSTKTVRARGPIRCEYAL